MKNGRKAISKRIRFEVFKRDSFKCQYCGATAPDVLLQVDHIRPIADGGTDDITNLVTACEPCNLGKGARKLDTNTAVAKARAQTEALQERRQQLEMLMEWQRGLVDLDAETLNEVCDFWSSLTPGYSPSESGRADLRKWLKQFGVAEVLASMPIAASHYLERDSTNAITLESASLAFGKVPGICVVKRREKDEPNLQRLYYIRAILRNRLTERYYDHNVALQLLRSADSWGVDLNQLTEIAINSHSWSNFRTLIIEAIEEAKAGQ